MKITLFCDFMWICVKIIIFLILVLRDLEFSPENSTVTLNLAEKVPKSSDFNGIIGILPKCW